MEHDINEKIKRMSEYLDNESIARALGVKVELVNGILSGEVTKIESKMDSTAGVSKSAPVKYVRAAYRQRVISVVRMKGGVGATMLTANLARYLSEQNKVLMIDLCTTENYDSGIRTRKVSSDLLDVFEMEFIIANNNPEALEIDTNLHYIPVLSSEVKELLYTARQEYDQIIIDLPNITRFETDALEASTTLLIIYSGQYSEAERLLELNRFDREKVLAAHMKLLPEGKNLIEERLEVDNYLQVPELDGIVSLKSPAHQSIAQISAMLFGSGFNDNKKGLLGRLFHGKW
ncbi:MAG: Sporulation initiation inhibitor protein Soj [Pelotomaculum sp. PtaU1.Bin065]|nr:MAG: Sporulation initiation inhibitor protein Soj [Pelotomaculum sp. PtaU1.Bin065]